MGCHIYHMGRQYDMCDIPCDIRSPFDICDRITWREMRNLWKCASLLEYLCQKKIPASEIPNCSGTFQFTKSESCHGCIWTSQFVDDEFLVTTVHLIFNTCGEKGAILHALWSRSRVTVTVYSWWQGIVNSIKMHLLGVYRDLFLICLFRLYFSLYLYANYEHVN